jgi:two-component system, OmpR family, phosphate regulon sensor histidine kinase PhoR
VVDEPAGASEPDVGAELDATAGVGQEWREVAITVSDRGPGIEAEDRQRLFEAFFRGRRAREEQLPGSGLGLAIVRRVADSHGGRVEISPATTPGTSFTLVLPIATNPAPATAPNAQTHPAR